MTYENGAPIFTCEKCGHQELTWKKFYEEYLQLFNTKSNWDEKKHQVSCIIGFFCYMYKEKYKTDYTFVPANPNPYGAKECRDSWALLASFGGNAHEVRKYIYWLFKQGINSNTQITHFGYINTAGLIRKYKLYAMRKNTFTRASKLPQDFIDWCRLNVPEIFDNYTLNTMNDLAAMIGYTKNYGVTNSEEKVMSAAKQFGLIENGKLCIGVQIK